MNRRIPAAAASIVVLGLALGFGASAASAGTAGSLDPAFGNGGIVLTNLGLDANGNQIQGNPSAAALQSDGDIVVAVGTGGPDAGLVRYLPDGTRDTTFGNGGFAALPDIGIPSFRPALAVQSDGKVVWAGGATAANGTGASFGVVRFNANGTLDQGFGSGGVATTTFPAQNASVQGAQTVLLQPDGKILVGGENIAGGRPPTDFGALARFNPDGSIDATFGTGGQAEVRNANFTTLGLDASGDVFVLSVNPGQPAGRFEFSPAGQLDASVTPAAITASSHGGTAAFLPSGGFVTTSTVTITKNTDIDAQVQRFNPDGSLASASTTFDYASTTGLATHDSGAAVAVQANGQAVTAGSHVESTQTQTTSVIGLARVNADGSLDAAFGAGGVLTTRIQGSDSALVVLIQPDGKILAIGSSRNSAGVTELALARYLSQ